MRERLRRDSFKRFASAAALAVALTLGAAQSAGAVVARDACDTALVICEESTHTYGASITDWNDDGRVDVLMIRHFESFPRLYSGIGNGRFTDSTRGRFEGARRRDWHGCDWGDVNRDGRQDLYCTVGGKKGGTAPNNKHLWIQRPNGTFDDVTRTYKVADRYGRGRTTTFIDANGDSFPDLFVGNTYPREDGRRSPNRLFINYGHRYRNKPRFGLTRQVGATSSDAADYDRDGREDLLLCGKERLFLYKNRRNNGFEDVARRERLPRHCRTAAIGQMGGGSGLDVAVMSRDTVAVYIQQQRGFRRTFFRRDIRGAWELELGDVNGDRRDDLYVLRQGPRNRDRSDLMLVNRRGGQRFENIRIPQYRRGKGDAVQAFDHDGNGLDDFIVMQGHRNLQGPIRLVAFYKN